MSIEIMKKAVIGAAGAIALLGANSALATNVSPNPPENDYTFQGTANLTQYGIPASGCTLTLIGGVTIDSGTGAVTIEVKDGSSVSGSGGSALCDSVNLNLDPSDSSTWWTATIAEGDLPSPRYGSTANGVFNNLAVSALGACGDSTAPATYTNGSSAGAPSSFTFNTSLGTCSIDGTVSVISDGDSSTSPADIDVWQ